MRARTVLITLLCAAALAAAACQPNSAGQDTGQDTGQTSTPSPRPATSDSQLRTSSTEPTTVRTVFDRQRMQTSVLRILADTYQVDGVEQVSCPSGQRVVDGATFQCTVVINGTDRQVTITVRGTEGEYVVSPPR